MNRISPTLLRQTLFLLITICIGVLLFWHLRFFVSAVLGAYTLFVLLSKPMAILTERWRWPRTLAAILLMLLSFGIVFLPLFYFFRMLNFKVMEAADQMPLLLSQLDGLQKYIEQETGFKVLTTENTKEAINWTLGEVRMLLQSTLKGLGSIIATYFILFFMLCKGRNMADDFFNWLPLKNTSVQFVRAQLDRLVYSNALGIPIMSLVQGTAALIALLILGIESPMFWFAMICITSVLPYVGVILTFVPLCLVLWSDGMATKALILMGYGLIVVGSVDNLFRMWFLQKIGHTHPLITVSGVIIGLKLFGFIGFIFGPILVSFFLLLVQLYDKEYGEHVLKDE